MAGHCKIYGKKNLPKYIYLFLILKIFEKLRFQKKNNNSKRTCYDLQTFLIFLKVQIEHV